MKVKVIKAKRAWYKKKIGKVFEVYPIPTAYYGGPGYTIGKQKGHGPGILVEDCIVIEGGFKMLKSYQDQKSGEPV